MRKPDFFLVGAAKAGTTSLFQYLTQHPRIFIPPIKEPHYFSEYYDSGAPVLPTIDDYLRLFDGCPDEALAGDASTSYLYSVDAAQRILNLQPAARIMAVLRNPVDRAYSLYWFNRRDLVENLGFEQALAAETERISENRHFRFHYVTSGMYADQLQKYFDAFGRDAVRVYLFEDLRADGQALCRDIFSFLGVPTDLPLNTGDRFNPSGEPRSRLLSRVLTHQFPRLRSLFPGTAKLVKHRLMRYNVQSAPPMISSTRAALIETFRPDVERLEELIGRDLGRWKAA